MVNRKKLQMPRQKLGRNDPCWCGSGKKYKYCHLNHESKTTRTPHETFKSLRKEFSVKKCMAPEGWLDNCKGGICQAHTVPKSGSLKRIARDGHVYNMSSPHIRTENQRRIVPTLIGVNLASTFYGFCSRHDHSVFAPIEKEVFRGTSQQCFLLGYRALAMEMYKKHALYRSLGFILNTDNGRTFEEQFEIQTLKNAFEIGVRTALKDYNHYKPLYDSILENHEFCKVRAYVIEFENTQPVMCSGVANPEYDFKGIKLQDVADLSKTLDLLCFTSFFGGEHGIAAFCWLAENDPTCGPFIKSLVAIPDELVSTALLRFIFSYFENVYMKPDWWENLAVKPRNAIISRSNHFVLNDPGKATLADDGMIYDPWNIVRRYHIPSD